MSKMRQILKSESKPGWNAHILACPPGRPKDLPARAKCAKRAGVACVMWWDIQHGWTVTFMKRTEDKSPHSGQWAFPGGAEESVDGGDLVETARRECLEEIGVLLQDHHVLGQLSPLYIPPSDFLVQPIVAVVDAPPTFKLQKDEVAEIGLMPLKELPHSGQTWPMEQVRVKGQSIRVPGWPINEDVLWGATAMITAELIEICVQAGFGRSFATLDNRMS